MSNKKGNDFSGKNKYFLPILEFFNFVKSERFSANVFFFVNFQPFEQEFEN